MRRSEADVKYHFSIILYFKFEPESHETLTKPLFTTFPDQLTHSSSCLSNSIRGITSVCYHSRAILQKLVVSPLSIQLKTMTISPNSSVANNSAAKNYEPFPEPLLTVDSSSHVLTPEEVTTTALSVILCLY